MDAMNVLSQDQIMKEILKLRIEGKSIREISKELKVPVAFIYQISSNYLPVTKRLPGKPEEADFTKETLEKVKETEKEYINVYYSAEKLGFGKSEEKEGKVMESNTSDGQMMEDTNEIAPICSIPAEVDCSIADKKEVPSVKRKLKLTKYKKALKKDDGKTDLIDKSLLNPDPSKLVIQDDESAELIIQGLEAMSRKQKPMIEKKSKGQEEIQLDVTSNKKEETEFIHYYFVDTENTGTPPISHLFNQEDPWHILFFCTDYSARMDLKMVEALMQHHDKIEFEHCVHTKKDSLDFQLVSQLGFMLAEHGKESQYTIISDDNGFDAAIAYWNQKGYRLDRLGHATQYATMTEAKQEMDTIPNSSPMIPIPVDNDPLEKEIITTAKLEKTPVELPVSPSKMRPVGHNVAGMISKKYKKAIQIMSSQIGSILKKKQIKVSKVPEIAEFMLCHVDYTRDELTRIVGLDAAQQIIDKVNRKDVNDAVILARRRAK